MSKGTRFVFHGCAALWGAFQTSIMF